ncbi:MAG TPA: helix-turn-helix domain-containing protein [Longimicrobiales bacterium]
MECTPPPADAPVVRPCAPHDVLSRLGDKWTVLVLASLAFAPGRRLRFSELKAGIEGVSQRMLTTTLRGLERDGLLVRHVYPEVPPRVEYELTAMGQGLLEAMDGLVRWVRENWAQIEAARERYDGGR